MIKWFFLSNALTSAVSSTFAYWSGGSLGWLLWSSLMWLVVGLWYVEPWKERKSV